MLPLDSWRLPRRPPSVKPPTLETVPDLHQRCRDATKQAAKVEETTDIAGARKLLDLIDQVDVAWGASGAVPG